MPRTRKLLIVDECRRIQLPWSSTMRPYDAFRVQQLGKGAWKFTLVHAESLPPRKFKRILFALKDRSRDDIHLCITSELFRNKSLLHEGLVSFLLAA